MNQDSKMPLDENVELMLKAADGDIGAFKSLYKKFAPSLRHYFLLRGVNPCSADDLVQKIFLSLWQQRKNYYPASSFETYLYSIARNALNNEKRRSRRIGKISPKKHPGFVANTNNILSQPEAEVYFQELNEALKKAKEKLTFEQKQAFLASQARDIDFHKTLEELGCSKGAYKKRLKRARKRIMELLDPYFTDEEKRKKD